MKTTKLSVLIVLSVGLVVSIASFAENQSISSEQNPIVGKLGQVSPDPESHENKCDANVQHRNQGIRGLYCRFKDIADFRDVEKIFGGSVFLSGQDADNFQLERKESFAHYNPEFVKWFTEDVIPDPKDARIIKLPIIYMMHM